MIDLSRYGVHVDNLWITTGNHLYITVNPIQSMQYIIIYLSTNCG